VKKRGDKIRLIIISIIYASFLGCTSSSYKAPVIDAQPIPDHRIKTHTVAPGETVYSIALRYDLDYKKLSSINNLDNQYRIAPGQTLNLDVSGYRPPDKSVQSVARSAASKIAGKVESSKNKSVNVPVRAAPTKPNHALQWQWPVKGEVLEEFQPDSGLNKGIDIRGKLGEPVLAAADGEVVYSGTGLRGYGKLVIVKHNEQYLSAYAHNRVLVVAEGDKVKAGQKITEVGFSGTNTAKLHFEIRLDGQPVNPLG